MRLSWMKTPSKIYTKTHFVDKNIKALPFPEKPAFKGRMFILVDRNSTSAPEEFVMLAKKCFGEDTVTIVGESSYGNIEFGNLLDYSLPNSELTFHVASDTVAPAMEKLSNWHGEGKGIYPDVWSTDEDMLETLVAVTGDEALRDVLKGMK